MDEGRKLIIELNKKDKKIQKLINNYEEQLKNTKINIFDSDIHIEATKTQIKMITEFLEKLKKIK